MTFIRFVIHKNDLGSGRRQGIFQAMADLEDSGMLAPHEQAEYDLIYNWFRKNLTKPRRFSRSNKPHAKNVALSWFRDTAAEHISRIRRLCEILSTHGVLVEALCTERPGYIVYEDDFQIAAEPFYETTT
jgi:hypothetical protein